ncbi:metallophosphoesterase [Sporosarcina ureilytica]|uniref:metallophosphoesterase n=1 Tax=Sporosarcina ureilytica TaxID=298596 RepID=UPI00143A4263|nr:metallophosphoesterase [Sporosarcina ureilytica]
MRHYLKVGTGSNASRKLKVFFISDIHKRKIDEKLLKKLDKDIDLVIIGGDLAEKNVPLSRITRNVQKLSQLGQLFYVWGNNDREVGEEKIRQIILQHEGIILENENMQINCHPTWGICGTDDPSCLKLDVEQALEKIEHYQNVLFVSHQPAVWEKVEQIYHPTLMLAGHTHGGQIRLGKFGISEKGSYESVGGRGKLISNGYGTTTLPLRLGARPECHIITISYTE